MAHQVIVHENHRETIYDISVMTPAEAEEMMYLMDEYFDHNEPTAENIAEYERYEAIAQRHQS